MRSPTFVLGVLLLTPPAGAQTRLATPEIPLSPSPLTTGASRALPLTATSLIPAARIELSALPPLPATALAQAIRAQAVPVQTAAAEPAPTNATPVAKRLNRMREVMAGALEWLKPKPAAELDPMAQIPWSFKLKDGDFYYHGTTLQDLARVVDSGGEMAPEVSQYSIRSADSIMYATGRRQKLARNDNPAVLLQFRYDDLTPLVSADAFKADVLASAQMSYFSLHSAYAAATKPVPLSMMTLESKESILAFLRARELERPDEPKWAELRAKFERALGY